MKEVKNHEGKKTRSHSDSDKLCLFGISFIRPALPSSPIAQMKLPLWVKLLLKLPCPRFPQCLQNWEGLFTSIGSTAFIICAWWFEVWLAAHVSAWTPFVPLRWLIVAALPLVVFIVYLRIALQRFVNTLRTLH